MSGLELRTPNTPDMRNGPIKTLNNNSSGSNNCLRAPKPALTSMHVGGLQVPQLGNIIATPSTPSYQNTTTPMYGQHQNFVGMSPAAPIQPPHLSHNGVYHNGHAVVHSNMATPSSMYHTQPHAVKPCARDCPCGACCPADCECDNCAQLWLCNKECLCGEHCIFQCDCGFLLPSRLSM